MSASTITTTLIPIYRSNFKTTFNFIAVEKRSVQRKCNHKFGLIVGPTSSWPLACRKCGLRSR